MTPEELDEIDKALAAVSEARSDITLAGFSLDEAIRDLGATVDMLTDRVEAAEKVCEAARLWRLGRGLNPQGDLIAAIDAWLVAKGEKPDAEA